MRIAILHYTKPPVIGGVERVIRDQAAALETRGHEVTLWSADDSSAFERVIGDDSSPLHGPFLHLSRPNEKHRHLLPHWHQDGVWCFISWRLADSLPQEFMHAWKVAREQWLRDNPKPWEPDQEAEYHSRFSEGLLEQMDIGRGACILRDESCADAVEHALQFFNGQRYSLKSFVIMPNHVHVLMRLHDEFPVERVVQNWKERSAKAINAAMGSEGQVWQKGYFDRLIRNANHWEFVDGYIRRNPQNAELKEGFRVWNADDSSAFTQGIATDHNHFVDAVIVHNVFTMPFDLAWTRRLHELAAAHPEIRWINWVHDVAAVNPNYAHLPWETPEMKLLSTPPQALHVAVSEVRRAEYLRVTQLHQSQCRVIPNGVDVASCLGLTDRVAAWVLQWQLWDRDLVLLHPTRMLRRKNIECGIRVVAELRSQGLDVAYLVTGACDPHQADGLLYASELRALANELKVSENVYFLSEGGEVSDQDVRGLYAVCDALFFPSFSEGFGLPVLEAGLHGVPVFCSDIPAHREVGGVFAHFFAIHALNVDIACEVTANQAVQSRVFRRKQLAAKVDWSRICMAYIEPLLNGTEYNS